MKSNLYGAYSIITGHGAKQGNIILWNGSGRKHPVGIYRRLIENYERLAGDEKIFAEDWVDFLFTGSETSMLLGYLVRQEIFGDRHIAVRAEDPGIEQLRQRVRKDDRGYFDLNAYDDWHRSLWVFGLEVAPDSLELTLS